MRNYFLQNRDPNEWNLRDALRQIEVTCPTNTHSQHLKSLKNSLREAVSSGTSAQKEAARTLKSNWRNECRALSQPMIPPVAYPQNFNLNDNVSMYINCHVESGASTSLKSDNPQSNREQQQHVYPADAYSLENSIQCEMPCSLNMASECRLYRSRSIEIAQDRGSLYDARILSLGYIFLLSDTFRCMLSPFRDAKLVLREFGRNDKLIRADPQLVENCTVILNMHDNGCDMQKLKDAVAKMSNVSGLSVLSKLIEDLAQLDNAINTREDLVKYCLKSFLDATICSISGLKARWSPYTLKPHPKTSNTEHFLPDFVLYSSRISSSWNLEYMVVEVKSKESNKCESDLVRIGKQMQILIDKMILQGVAKPVAVGILVTGETMRFYKMVLGGRGMYAMIELAQLHILRSPSDFPLIPSLVERFYQIKTIIEEMMESVEETLAERHRCKAQLKEDSHQRQALLSQACSPPAQQEEEIKLKKRKR